MTNYFSQSISDDEEYDLDQFIADYSDILNSHAPNFITNPGGHEKYTDYIDFYADNPYKDKFVLPIGLSNQEIFGEGGIPKEYFKTLNQGDVSAALRATNPALYNNMSNEQLMDLARRNGFSADQLVYNDQPGIGGVAESGLKSWWMQSNVGPFLQTMSIDFMQWIDETMTGTLQHAPIVGAPAQAIHILEGLRGEQIDWDAERAKSLKWFDNNQKAWTEEIKNNPDMRGYLRWKEDNPLDWDNWYDPTKMADIAFNVLPSQAITLTAGALTAAVSGPAGVYTVPAVMFGVSASMEGAQIWTSTLQELTRDINIDKSELNADISDYRNSLKNQLETPGYNGIDYLNDEKRYGKYDEVFIDGLRMKWKDVPAVKKKQYLDSQVNRFVDENFSFSGKDIVRKGMTLEEANDAARATSLIYAAVAGGIEMIPGVKTLDKLGLTGYSPTRVIQGMKSLKRVEDYSKIASKFSGRTLGGIKSKKTWSWLKIGIAEGFEEFGQYGAEVIASTQIPYKDPDTGGWKYGVSRDTFGEKWDWSEAMESMYGGFLVSGGTGLASGFARGLNEYTNITDRWQNFQASNNKDKMSSFFLTKTGDKKNQKFRIAQHYQDKDGKFKIKILERKDLEEFVPDSFDSFGKGFEIIKVMNESAELNKARMMWGRFGKYHGSTYTFEQNKDGKDVIVWRNSSGQIFNKELLSEIEKDDGTMGITIEEATKINNDMIQKLDGLYRYLNNGKEGDFSISQSGFKELKDNGDGNLEAIWDAPFGEEGIIGLKLGNDGVPILDKQGIPILEYGPTMGDKTKSAINLSTEEQKRAIEALKNNNQGKFVSFLKGFFKRKPKPSTAGGPNVKPIVTTTDTGAPIVSDDAISSTTKLKVRGFVGDTSDLTENEQQDFSKMTEEGTFGDYNKMKEGLDEYDSAQDFEDDTGIKFDVFSKEMEMTFPDEAPVTSDIFIKQEQKQDEFIDKETKKKEPPKKVSKLDEKSVQELESEIKETEEKLANAKFAGGKALLKDKIRILKKALDKKKVPVEKVDKKEPVDSNYEKAKKLVSKSKDSWKWSENISASFFQKKIRVEGKNIGIKEAKEIISKLEAEGIIEKIEPGKYKVKKEIQKRIVDLTGDLTESVAMENLLIRREELLNELKSLKKFAEEKFIGYDKGAEPILHQSIAAVEADILKIDQDIANLKKAGPQARKTTPKSKGEATVEEVTNILDKVASKFTMLGGGKFNVVVFDRENSEHLEYAINNNVDIGKDAGWYDPNTDTIYIDTKVAAKSALDTPFHEFMHPFITQLRLSNPKLFKELYDELNNPNNKFGAKIIADIKKDYVDLFEKDINRFMEEVIVTVIGKTALKSHLKSIKEDTKLQGWLKRVYQWIKELLFGKTAATNVYVRPWELDQNTTIKQLSEMLADLDGTYNFEVLDTKIQEEVLGEIRDQAGLGNSDMVIEDLGENILMDPDFNISSMDKLEGREWVLAHVALISEVKELFGTNLANILDASKMLKNIYKAEGKHIDKAIEKFVDMSFSNFDKFINSKFKLTKRKYKPSKKKRALVRNITAGIAKQFIEVALTTQPITDSALEKAKGAKEFLIKDKMLKKIDSPSFQKKLDETGVKIQDYIEKVRFNYTFSKIISQKSGKLNISQLGSMGHGGINTTTAERDIVTNEFVPFLQKNFKGVKSLESETIQEYYEMFMENNYGIIRYTTSSKDSYVVGLRHDAFHKNQFTDGRGLNPEKTGIHRIIFSDSGIVKPRPRLEEHKFKVEGMPFKPNGLGWFAIDVTKNSDGTTDIVGFEFQSDYLDHIQKVAKSTNNFGKKDFIKKGDEYKDPYYDFAFQQYLRIAKMIQGPYNVSGMEWMYTKLLPYQGHDESSKYYSLLFESLGPKLNGELNHDELDIFLKTVQEYQKGNITTERVLYPWEKTKSNLAKYGIVPEIVNNLQSPTNLMKFRKQFVKRFQNDKVIIIPMSLISSYNPTAVFDKIIETFETYKHEFNSRQLNLDRKVSKEHGFRVATTIFNILKKGSAEDKLLLKDIFARLNSIMGDFQKTIRSSEYQNNLRLNISGKSIHKKYNSQLFSAIMEIPGVTQALQQSLKVNMLGMKDVNMQDLLRDLGYSDTEWAYYDNTSGFAPTITLDGSISFHLPWFIKQSIEYKRGKHGLILDDGSINPQYQKFQKTIREGGNTENEELGEFLPTPEWQTSLNRIINYFYTDKNNYQNERRRDQQKNENFVNHFLIPIIGPLSKLSPKHYGYERLSKKERDLAYDEAAAAGLEYDDAANFVRRYQTEEGKIEIERTFDAVMIPEKIKANLGAEKYNEYMSIINDYFIRRESSIAANVFRQYAFNMNMLGQFGAMKGMVPEDTKDKTISYDESDWMSLFGLNKADLELNKKWNNYANKWFDKMIRFWMLDAQKYNGEAFLMLGVNHTVLGNAGGAPLYYSGGEAAVYTLGYNSSTVSRFNRTVTEKEIKEFGFSEFELALLKMDRLHSSYTTDITKIESFMLELYVNAGKDVKKDYIPKYLTGEKVLDKAGKPRASVDVNAIYQDFLGLHIAASKKLIQWWNSKHEEDLKSGKMMPLRTEEVGVFYRALDKIKKKEKIGLSYAIPKDGTKIMLRVHLEDVKSEKLKPLYMRKINKNQMDLFEPTTEEDVLDKVDNYIRDYHDTFVMDSHTMFRHILKDFKNVNKARYGRNIVDSELFKMSMLKTLTKYPDLKKEFIAWHDKEFANTNDTKGNRELGLSDSESGMEDSVADDYANDLTTIFEDYKDLGRFDDLISGNNTNENYYNILDFAWLKELGININVDSYNILIRRARTVSNKEDGSFKEFMEGVGPIVGRTRFGANETRKMKLFYNRIKSNINVNNKNAERKNWWIIKEQRGWGKPQNLRKVNRKGTENVIKNKSNPQYDRKTIFEHNEKHHPYIIEWIGKSDVFSKKTESDEQLVRGEENRAKESYEFFLEGELNDLNKQFNKEGRTLLFIRGDSKKIGVVKIHDGYIELAKDSKALKDYWTKEQKDGFIPEGEAGNQMIKELTYGSELQLAENIARHAAFKIIWPMYKHYPATTLMKRIKIPTTPGTFSDVRDFNSMFYDPKKATIVYEDGSTKKLFRNIPGVGAKYIGDGGDFVGKSFMSDYRVANGLKDDTVEMKTSIYQKDGTNVIMFKHNSFLVNKDMKIYENYGKSNERLIATVDNYVIKNADGDVIDMLSTDDEVKVHDGYNFEDIVQIKGSSMVTSFYNEDPSNKSSHGMQWYNYLDDGDIINALWNPNDGIMTLSLRRDLAELFTLGVETPNGKKMVKKIEDFLQKIIGNDADGFLPTVLEHAKLGAGLHPVVSTALDKLIQTRIINPGLNLKGRPGAKLVLKPNTDPNIKEKEISIPKHALGPTISKIASSLNVKSNELTIDMINDWLKDNNQRVLAFRTPIASILGAGIYKITSIHNNKNVVLMHEDNVFYDMEADQDADKIQIEYLNEEILDMMEAHLKEVEFNRHSLEKFIPENYDAQFSTNSTKDLIKLMGALIAGQNGLGEIAKAASIYGILNSWFDNIVINDRKIILTPKDYKMTWNTYYDGENKWTGTFPELLYIYLQAAADNAEFMLLGKWNYKREHMYQMMFKYEDDMSNIDANDLQVVLALVQTLKIPSNIRRGSDYANGRYFAKHTFKMSSEYSAFVSDRAGYLQSKLTEKKFSHIKSELNELNYRDNLHPLEIVAMMPHQMRSIKEYNNHILSSGDSPLQIPDDMHKNAHKDAQVAVLDEAMVEKFLNNALARDGMELLDSKEKSDYVNAEYTKAIKYVTKMKNEFFGLLTGKENHNYSSMDRDEAMIKFKDKHRKIFNQLSETARTQATFWFLEGFNIFRPKGKSVRAKVLKVLPPVSKSKDEYSLLEWRVMQQYYTEYNQSVMDRSDPQERYKNRVAQSFKKSIGEFCGRL